MTTSGTDAFNPSLSEILTQAARKVNAIGRTQTLPGPIQAEFLFELNALVKRWQAMPGYHCWTTVEGVLFPQVGQTTYRAGPSATDHITQQHYMTALTVDEILGAFAMDVDDTTNITIDDNIGVVLDDGTLHWSTVTGKTATTVNIAASLPDSAAAGNKVFTYTTKIYRPLSLLPDGARRYDIASANETPIILESRKDFRALPVKGEAGTITSLFYDKQIPQGIFNLWRVPTAVTELVYFTWNRPLESFLVNSNTPDFPQEWVQPLIWNLADCKAMQYPVDRADREDLKEMAAQFLADVMGTDRENESVFVQPNLDGYRY